MNSLRLTLALALGLWMAALPAQAYIPRTRMILDKTAKNDGRGYYLIEQEVQFQTEPENLITRETWLIQDGETMQVTIRVMSATGTQSKPLAIVYRGGNRTVVEVAGRIENSRLSTDAIEPFFHFRSVDGLGKHLVGSKMIPASMLSERRVLNLKNWKRDSDPNVALARIGNAVTFALGTTRSGNLIPSLWVDQDRFVIRKIRLPSNAEVVADNHEQFARGLIYPKDRTLTWDDKTVQIRTVSVKSLGDSHTTTKFNPQTLSNEEKLNGGLPGAAIVREFYSRFR